jgi:hypothetical protein
LFPFRMVYGPCLSGKLLPQIHTQGWTVAKTLLKCIGLNSGHFQFWLLNYTFCTGNFEL